MKLGKWIGLLVGRWDGVSLVAGCLLLSLLQPLLGALAEAETSLHSLFLPAILREDCQPAAAETSDLLASWSGPIAVSPTDGSVWVVNPDAGSVTALDGESLAKLAEIGVGRDPRSLAVGADGATVYVVTRADGELVQVDAVTKRVRARLFVGAQPNALVLAPDGRKAYISLAAEAAVAVVDVACFWLIDKIPVVPVPYALAVNSDGESEQVYVTHLLAQPRSGGGEGTDDGKRGIIS